MTPERWHQVTELFHAALACEPSAREAFLAQACRQDPALRVEVDRLIAGHLSLGPDSSELPVNPNPMLAKRLEPGAIVGPYRVERFVGAGGMGEVYRATDSRLRRAVALKVLAPEFASEPDRRARFEREAQMLAALQHPYIAAIHGLEEHDGVRFLVLEFVEGESLDDWIHAHDRSATETLRLAGQIAEALSAAHDRGIIHRDLKPANVKLTPAGDVRLLDFGIAKLASPADTSADGHGAAPSAPTLTAGRTREGSVIGSPAYMSPEQARAQAVDKRTDIWAFGCVLYEMLAKRRPFEAGTRSDVLAKILEREPDWDALPVDVPDGIRTLLRRCLAKDPAARLHDIADARLEIADALSPVARRFERAPARDQRRERVLWVALGTTAVALAVTLAWSLGPGNRTAPAAPPVEFGIPLPDTHMVSLGIAVSPDGRQIAAEVFGSAGQIYVHSLESSTTRPIPGTGRALFPFWSPDGRMLAFGTGADLRVMNPADGAQTVVCKTPGAFLGGTWSRDGIIVFASAGKLFRVPAGGGTPEPLALPVDRGEPRVPDFLPDQRHFIYTVAEAGGNVAMLASLDSADATRLINVDYTAAFAPPHYLLYVRGAALRAQTLDLGRRALAGDATVVASNATPGVLFARANFAASANVLAYGTPRGGSSGQLPWFDRNGVAGGVLVGPANGGEYLNPAISPDGRFVAVNYVDADGNWDVWAVDVARNVSWRVTTHSARDSDPVWSPDSREIVFVSNRNGATGLYRKNVTGSEPATLLFSEAGREELIPNDWSSDGRHILYSRTAQQPRSIWALPLTANPTPVKAIDEQGQPYAPRVSPDGRWIAYVAFDSGVAEVYVQRFLAPGQKQQISHGGGVHPRWTREGRELVYWAVPGGVKAVDFTSSESSFRVGSERTLVHTPVLGLIDARPHYDVSRDGARLLVRQPSGPQGPGITVVLNWAERLKRTP